MRYLYVGLPVFPFVPGRYIQAYPAHPPCCSDHWSCPRSCSTNKPTVPRTPDQQRTKVVDLQFDARNIYYSTKIAEIVHSHSISLELIILIYTIPMGNFLCVLLRLIKFGEINQSFRKTNPTVFPAHHRPDHCCTDRTRNRPQINLLLFSHVKVSKTELYCMLFS